MKLGEILIQEGHLNEEGLQEAIDWQVLYGGRLGTNLLELKLVEEEHLARALGRQLGVEVAWGELEVEPEMLGLVPRHVADRNELVPWKMEKRRLKVLSTEASRLELVDEIARRSGRVCGLVVAPEFRMFQLLRKHYQATRQMRALDFGVVPIERENLRRKREKAQRGNVEEAPELIDESAFQQIYAQVLEGRSPGGDVDAVDMGAAVAESLGSLEHTSDLEAVQVEPPPHRPSPPRPPPPPLLHKPAPRVTPVHVQPVQPAARPPPHPASPPPHPPPHPARPPPHPPPHPAKPPPHPVAAKPAPPAVKTAPPGALKPPAAATLPPGARPPPPAVKTAPPGAIKAPPAVTPSPAAQAPGVARPPPHPRPAPSAASPPAAAANSTAAAPPPPLEQITPVDVKPVSHPVRPPLPRPPARPPPPRTPTIMDARPVPKKAPPPSAPKMEQLPDDAILGEAELVEEAQAPGAHDTSEMQPLQVQALLAQTTETPGDWLHPPGAQEQPPPARSVPLAAWDAPPPEPIRAADEPPLDFKQALLALAGVTDRDAIARIVLRTARSMAKRALLMTVQGNVALGWDGLGEGMEGNAARAVAVPLSPPSAFQLVVRSRSHFLGPLQKTETNIRFLGQTGKKVPLSSLIVPILHGERVSHLLYLDNGHKQQAPTDVGEMLILSQRIAQTVAALLEKKRQAARG